MGRSRKAFFLAVAAALPALVACNAILGIDDFRRVQCETDPCEVPDSGPDRVEPDRIVPDGGPDTGLDAPPGVDPVSWAAFKMPNYLPTVDAGSTVNPIAYNTAFAEEVEDTVTGLVWRKVVIGAPAEPFGFLRSQEAARAECQKLGPWRLPKRIELVTLISYGHPAPAIDTTAFPNFPSNEVWTSSEVRPLNGEYWAVDFQTGEVIKRPKATGANVLCVKAK